MEIKFDDAVRLIVPAIQVGVVVLGWFVVSRGNDKREKRREIRALLNDVRTNVLHVEQLAYEYYTASAQTSADCAKCIKRDLKKVSMLMVTITRLDHSLDLSDSLVQFRQAVTGNDFESFGREARSLNDSLFGEIAIATTNFVNSMEEMYSRTYP